MAIVRTRYKTRINFEVPNQVDLAWVAGYLEGEGCFSVDKRLSRYVRVQVTSADLDVLERFMSIVKIGYIHEKRTGGRRYWCWACTRRRDAVALMEAVYPFLGQRRQKRIRELISPSGASSL